MFVAMSKRQIEVPWICQAIRISMTCASEAHLSSAKIDNRLSWPQEEPNNCNGLVKGASVGILVFNYQGFLSYNMHWLTC